MAAKKGTEGITEKKYNKSLSLWRDDDNHRWQVGKFAASIALEPRLTLGKSHNINAISINLTNNGHDNVYKNFAMGIDSVGLAEDGNDILHTKFSEAYDQLEKNKQRLEKLLEANIDLSVLKTLSPLITEFERRADGRSPGNEVLSID